MTTLPDIRPSTSQPQQQASQTQRMFLSHSMPGPVYLPGVSMRNPITGRGYVYSNYAWSKQYPRITPHNIKEHDNSVFSNTNINSSFYVIAPDWTSEGQSIRKTVALERNHFAWDNRPAVQPMRETSRDTYLPLLHKKARQAQAPVNEYYKNMVNHFDRYVPKNPYSARGRTPAATQPFFERSMTLPVVSSE